ncbi:MAG TPA: polysaccharide deacetylase family protein, partial [Gemmatimonadaceae bacterium]|nr:polysaccharide deacetylase family protein [Gemmatimonadaceae bacterium]
MTRAPLGPTVAFTVDLEPDCPPFLRGFRGIEHGLPELLELLDQLDIRATFFTTGEVALAFPRAVDRVVGAGHELGCHGMTHTAFTSLDAAGALDEIERSADVLRQFSAVTSFRAPYLKLPDAYVDLLSASGFTADSSQARYKLAYYRSIKTGGVRRYPASLTSSALRLPRLVRRAYLSALDERKPIVLFVHPWEFVD